MTRKISTFLALALLSVAAQGATVTIANGDGVGEGFNDSTAVVALASNPGTTLGEQRLNVFNAAAAFWGDILDSSVTIVVEAQMDPLTCNSSSAVLGAAGTQTVHRNFVGAPLADTWYHQPLANSLNSSDLSGFDDIFAQFNSSIDFNNSCLNGIDWWYGIGEDAPSGTIGLFEVVLHEIGHGLGVSTFVNSSTGAEFSGSPDAYSVHLEDHSLGLQWDQMSNAQRQASAIDTGDLHWTGDSVTGESCFLTAGTSSGHVRMYAPNPVQGGSSVSHFDTVVTPDELMEPFATPTPLQHLTEALLRDEGWQFLQIFADGFESDTCRFSFVDSP